MNREFHFSSVPYITFSTGENIFYVCKSERARVPVVQNTLFVPIQLIMCTIHRGKISKNYNSFHFLV